MLAVLTSLSAFASLLHGSEGDKRANSAETSGALQQFEMKIRPSTVIGKGRDSRCFQKNNNELAGFYEINR